MISAIKAATKQVWLWLVAVIAVMGVIIKALYDKSERLERKVENAEAKVDAAKNFRKNRRRAVGDDLDDIHDDIRRMFPPSGGGPDPPT